MSPTYVYGPTRCCPDRHSQRPSECTFQEQLQNRGAMPILRGAEPAPSRVFVIAPAPDEFARSSISPCYDGRLEAKSHVRWPAPLHGKMTSALSRSFDVYGYRFSVRSTAEEPLCG